MFVTVSTRAGKPRSQFSHWIEDAVKSPAPKKAQTVDLGEYLVFAQGENGEEMLLDGSYPTEVGPELILIPRQYHNPDSKNEVSRVRSQVNSTLKTLGANAKFVTFTGRDDSAEGSRLVRILGIQRSAA